HTPPDGQHTARLPEPTELSHPSARPTTGAGARVVHRPARGAGHHRRGRHMPELPEVEVVRRGLQRWVAHRTVADAEVLHPRAVRRHLAGADDFTHRLKGHRVGVPSRRGKYLWLPLEDT